MDFALAPEAATLTAVRIVHGRPITYITGEQGRPAIERALSEACALGHLAAPENQHHGTIPPWPPKVDEHHGVLDILDERGHLVQDVPLPLVIEPSSRPPLYRQNPDRSSPEAYPRRRHSSGSKTAWNCTRLPRPD